MEVFGLRIKRTQAGKSFPFDRIYIVRHKDKDVIEKLFRYALVMPLDGDLKERLLTLLKEEKDALEFDDQPHDRSTGGRAPNPASLFSHGDWVVAVPILPKWAKKNVPRYLVAQGWYAESRRKKANDEPFPKHTFLLTPEKKIRPVCVACPRFILHQNGDCKLGDRVCLDTLPMGLINHFDEAPFTPPEVNQVEPTDTEIQEILNANVQDDDA